MFMQAAVAAGFTLTGPTLATLAKTPIYAPDAIHYPDAFFPVLAAAVIPHARQLGARTITREMIRRAKTLDRRVIKGPEDDEHWCSTGDSRGVVVI